MTKDVDLVRIFVGSPSDVAEERGILETVVREASHDWLEDHSYAVELVRWETHTYPGFGEDAQDVVKREIGDSYDVFIGIMWARVGTPTGRAESGTVEEFNEAYERFKSDPNSVHLMMYFKTAPVPYDEIDPFQITKVREFKQRVADLGGFYQEFLHSDDFGVLVRRHLTQYLRDKRRQSGPSEAATEQPHAAAQVERDSGDSLEEDEETGLIDLLEESERASEDVNTSIGAMREALESLGAKTASRTSEMQAAASLPEDKKRKEVKRVAKGAAGDMDDYVAVIEAQLPVFRDGLSSSLRSFGQVASLSIDFESEDAEQLEGALSAAGTLKQSMSSARSSMSDFRNTVASLPRITTAMNRSRRRVVDVTDTLMRELANAETMLEGVEADIKRLIATKKEDTTK